MTGFVAERDVALMRRAIEVAGESDADDIPIGALVVRGDTVLATAANDRHAGSDPTAHAEILALRRAGEAVGAARLDGCDLIVTLEPCPMCAGAAVAARVDRVVFGAWNDRYGACGSLFDIPRDRRLHHRPEVVGGVLADETGLLVRRFLTERR